MPISSNLILNRPIGNHRLSLTIYPHKSNKNTLDLLEVLNKKMEFPTVSDLILQELQRPPLEVTFEPTRPYTSNMTIDEKVKRTYRSLLKARRVKNRILTLLNAFFLGQLLNDDISPAQRTLQCQTMTTHYHQSATRIYHLFETFGIQK